MNEQVIDKTISCTEGVLFSFQMLNIVNTKLYDICLEIEKKKENVYEALFLAWSFIDCVHRIREISQQFPTLSKNDRRLINFIEATKITSSFRNYIQHLRGELTKNERLDSPVWGTLSWIDDKEPHKMKLVMLTMKTHDVTYSGCIYDTYEKKWVSRVSLSLGDLTYNFDSLFKEVQVFINYLKSYLAEIEIKINTLAIEPQIITCWIEDNRNV